MKALITGTSAGIGRACAELFLQRGWHVYGFDIALSSIAHAEYEHFVVDVRDRTAFPAGLEPDVIVNNAGVQGADDIAVNLQGTINITEAYAFVGVRLSMSARRADTRVPNFPSMRRARAAFFRTRKTSRTAWRRREFATASTQAVCLPSSIAP